MAPASKPKRKVPHSFVLEALDSLSPEVRPLFSGFAVYVGNRLLLMLRDSLKTPQDNGVWLVLAEGVDPDDKGLRRELPSLRSIETLGGKIDHWLLIPSDGDDFEGVALRACELILRGDRRLGRVPKSRR